ncbi:MAG TPA: efflux RND transporter periplasmic adaptor subunit [Lacunisphaera sp.]|jgi:RND family efflux transporter MFP subunit|nr:efflux RND transporter periplasmic adaptor subunit [Lacunisphaera sp.]
MRNKFFGLPLLISLVVIAAGIWAISYYLRPVALVEVVVKGRAVNAVPGSVNVTAEYNMELKSEIAGRVLRSQLELGRVVHKGDFLVELDSGDLKLEIAQIEADAESHRRRVEVGSSIKLELANDKDDLVEKERMFKLGGISEAELTRQRRLVQQVEQRVQLEDVENEQKTETYKNQLAVKRRQLDKMTFLAPFDGVISELFARPGDLIGANSPIATIISTSRTVEAKVSEENFAGIRVGQKASVRFLGYGSKLYDATVSKILPTADAETQRYVVYLDVAIAPEKLVPGLTGEVSIVLGEREANAILPRRALRGNEVFVVADNRVELRKVKPGYIGLNVAEILDGLKPGEYVLVEELDQFKAGDRVRTKIVTE